MTSIASNWRCISIVSSRRSRSCRCCTVNAQQVIARIAACITKQTENPACRSSLHCNRVSCAGPDRAYCNRTATTVKQRILDSPSTNCKQHICTDRGRSWYVLCDDHTIFAPVVVGPGGKVDYKVPAHHINGGSNADFVAKLADRFARHNFTS